MLTDIKDFIIKHKDKLIFWTMLLLLTLFACYPYLNRLPLWGGDMSFHVNRIIGIAEGLKSAEFPVIINSNIVDGMGYASALFYPELFLYIPAVLNVLGLGVMLSYRLFIMIATFFTFLFMYICIKRIFKSRGIAVIGTILYTLSLYRLEDLYIRAALGEVLAFVFLPLVILGIYEIIYGDKKKWYILTLGIFGVANCHMISFVMTIGIILFLVLTSIVKLWHEKDRLKYLIICAIVTILTCFSAFLPMLEQVKDGEYILTEREGLYQLEEQAATITKMFENTLHKGEAVDTNKTMVDSINMGPGLLLMIIPVCIVFCNNKKEKNRKFIYQLLIMGIIAIIMTTKIFPWKYFEILDFIQFPWRINMVTTICLSIVSAYVLCELVHYKKETIILLCIVLIGIASTQLENSKCMEHTYTYESMLARAPIGNEEYIPMNFVRTSILTDTSGEIQYEYTKERNKITFDYTENTKSKTGEIVVPLTYYKGYIATIETENGTVTLETNKSPTGTVLIQNKKQLLGTITVEYKMTKIQIISYLMTSISMLGVLCYAIFKKKQTNNSEKE